MSKRWQQHKIEQEPRRPAPVAAANSQITFKIDTDARLRYTQYKHPRVAARGLGQFNDGEQSLT